MTKIEGTVFRAAVRALRQSGRPLDFRGLKWGASMKAAAASCNFIAEDTVEAGSFLELENMLQDGIRTGRSEVALVRSYLDGSFDLPPFLNAEIGNDSADAIDVGLALLRLCIGYDQFIAMLKQEGLVSPPEAKYRPTITSSCSPAHVPLFCVGDVLEHRFFGQCVVVGWSLTCSMGEDWIVENCIRENLRNGPEQPFYHVLLKENPIPRCVSQENVALVSSLPSYSPQDDAGVKLDLRTSFDHAAAYYFTNPKSYPLVLSDELRMCYPDDDAFRAKLTARDFRCLKAAVLPPYAKTDAQ